MSKPPKNNTEKSVNIIDLMKEAIASSAASIIKTARIHNTPIISWQEDKIIKIDPFSIKLDEDKKDE